MSRNTTTVSLQTGRFAVESIGLKLPESSKVVVAYGFFDPLTYFVDFYVDDREAPHLELYCGSAPCGQTQLCRLSMVYTLEKLGLNFEGARVQKFLM